jgi:preprotein translocase subunit SecE
MNANADKAPSDNGEGALDIVKWGGVAALVAAVVVGNSYFGEHPVLYRAAGALVLLALAAWLALSTGKGRQFNAFRKEAMVELRKVVWPTRPETRQTTLVVFAMVVVTSIFFWGLDLFLGWIVSKLIG